MKAQVFLFSCLPPLIAIALALGGFLLFSGCYTLKQGTIMLGYLGKALPLDRVDSSPEEIRAFAGEVADIRRFAMEELGLKESKNYTGYVEIDRDYLAAVVSACAGDSFTRHEWWFPVVGSVPYKGFFDPEDARREAARLKKGGFDVWVRGVDAFSTLGWFKDPLYSYMKEYPVHRLADLIIHELLHATVFIKGHVQFNEQLAEFVGTEGARLYVAGRFGEDSPEYRAIGAEAADSAAFQVHIQALIAELEALYADTDIDGEAKLAEKARIIKASQEQFAAEYDRRFTSENYRGFSSLPVNNAYLDLFRLYHGEDNFFAGIYEKNCESSAAGLRRFIEAAKTLKPRRAAGPDGGLRQQLEQALER
jgi:predicted aminopeptidase